MTALIGEWINGARWLLYSGSRVPDETLVTSVVCITFNAQGVVLSATERGIYEHLGGHVESGEAIENTLKREALREGGAALSACAQFAYREVMLDRAVINSSTNRPYPKLAYVPYFVGYTESPLLPPSGHAVQAARAFGIASALNLPIEEFPERDEFELALKACAERIGAYGLSPSCVTPVMIRTALECWLG